MTRTLILASVIGLAAAGCERGPMPNAPASATPTATSKPATQPHMTMMRVERLSSRDDGRNLEMTLRITNVSGKSYASISGQAVVKDQFGDELFGMNIKLDEPLAAGALRVITGSYLIFDERHRKIINAGRATFEFRLDKVVHPDGRLEVVNPDL